MRATKPRRASHPEPLRTRELSGLKQLRAAAVKAAAAAATTAAASQAAAAAAPKGNNATGDAGLNVNDISLFRQAMKTVTPIRNVNRVIAGPVPMAAIGMLAERRLHASGSSVPLPVQVSDHFMAAHVDHDDRSFVRSRDSGDLIKGLKRGKWPVEASLDLHGSTLDQARLRMDGFLQSCLEHRIRCVRIVHGKGYGSRDGTPVLKDVVRRWLTQLAPVQAYTECPERDGGAGAVQVLLTPTTTP